MLDLIYSSSILLDSCRCLPAQKKKKKYFFSWLLETVFFSFFGLFGFFLPKNIEEDSRFPTVLSYEEDGCTLILIPLLSAHEGGGVCYFFISMHHNGFTKSFACCLSCESCLCAQCQMPGQGGRWCWAGEVRLGSQPGPPSPEVSLYSQSPGEILHQSPLPPCPTPPKPITRTWRWAEPGKNTLFFDPVFKTTKTKEWKKRNSFFICWQPF